MCGRPDVIDGYCCRDHRAIHAHQTEAAMLRATLLEIVALGPDGAWYVELARAGHLRTVRT
jgi:hypothetical protein